MLAADWSGDARRRAVYVASLAPAPEIRRAPPPARGWSLSALLDRARALRERPGAGVLIAIDAVLGVPAGFARRARVSGFLECLEWLARGDALDAECAAPDDWSPHCPFFRVPAGRGGLTRWISAAGGPQGVLREVEQRMGAKPVFVLSGIPGTVGSGSRALWRELAPLAARTGRDFAIWPFEGGALPPAPGGIALAEAYPRAAYAIALESARPLSLAKGRADVRRRALTQLQDARWVHRSETRLGDLAHACNDGDHFDALLTAAALLRLLLERRPLAPETIDPLAEGAILPPAPLRPISARST